MDSPIIINLDSKSLVPVAKEVGKIATLVIEKLGKYSDFPVDTLCMIRDSIINKYLIGHKESNIVMYGSMNNASYQSRIENINKINAIANAIPYITNSSNINEVEEDFLLNFFDLCKNCSNVGMRQIWSKILAEEINKPKTFSFGTLNTVSLMSIREAEIFERISRFVLHCEDNSIKPFPYIGEDHNPAFEEIYCNNGIRREELATLHALKVIISVSLPITIGPSSHRCFKYHGKEIRIRHKHNLKLGTVYFSVYGLELFNILKVEPIPHFEDFVISKWQSEGVELIK